MKARSPLPTPWRAGRRPRRRPWSSARGTPDCGSPTRSGGEADGPSRSSSSTGARSTFSAPSSTRSGPWPTRAARAGIHPPARRARPERWDRVSPGDGRGDRPRRRDRRPRDRVPAVSQPRDLPRERRGVLRRPPGPRSRRTRSTDTAARSASRPRCGSSRRTRRPSPGPAGPGCWSSAAARRERRSPPRSPPPTGRRIAGPLAVPRRSCWCAGPSRSSRDSRSASSGTPGGSSTTRGWSSTKGSNVRVDRDRPGRPSTTAPSSRSTSRSGPPGSRPPT